jgi:hypothetical protein
LQAATNRELVQKFILGYIQHRAVADRATLDSNGIHFQTAQIGLQRFDILLAKVSTIVSRRARQSSERESIAHKTMLVYAAFRDWSC